MKVCISTMSAACLFLFGAWGCEPVDEEPPAEDGGAADAGRSPRDAAMHSDVSPHMLDDGAVPDAPAPDAPPGVPPADAATIGPRETCDALPFETPLASGTRVVVEGQLYALYGMLVSETGSVIGNANLFVLRGAETAAGAEVWVFGSTAGDPNSDFAACDSFGGDNIRSSREDAEDIVDIVRDCMAIPLERVAIRHVTPHSHFDHVTSDLFVSLGEVGFDIDRMIAYVHADEVSRVFSSTLCRGVPRVPAYPPSIVERAVALGDATDSGQCGRVVHTFETAALGRWEIVASWGHMSGDTSYLNMRGGVGDRLFHMTGALVNDRCYDYRAGEPAGFEILPIHADLLTYR